jgi:hypothetical protein
MGTNLFVIAGAILAIVAAAAGVVGYFKANVAQSTIQLYKDDNEALRTRLKTLEEQRTDDAAKIKALELARDYLSNVVTQAAEIAAVRVLVQQIADKVGA